MKIDVFDLLDELGVHIIDTELGYQGKSTTINGVFPMEVDWEGLASWINGCPLKEEEDD